MSIEASRQSVVTLNLSLNTWTISAKFEPPERWLHVCRPARHALANAYALNGGRREATTERISSGSTRSRGRGCSGSIKGVNAVAPGNTAAIVYQSMDISAFGRPKGIMQNKKSVDSISPSITGVVLKISAAASLGQNVGGPRGGC